MSWNSWRKIFFCQISFQIFGSWKKVTCNPSTHRHTYHHHHHTSRTIYSRFGEVEMSFLSWWSATESAIHLAVSSQLSQTKNSEPWEGLKIQWGGSFIFSKKKGKFLFLPKFGVAIEPPAAPLCPHFRRPCHYIWGTLAILRNLLRWRCVQLLV